MALLLLALLAGARAAHAQPILCDGSTDQGPAINRAIAAAAAGGGGTVQLPAGICRIDLAHGPIQPQSRVTLAGQGRAATTLLCDDSHGGGACLTNFDPAAARFAPRDHLALRALTLRGRADISRAITNRHLVALAAIDSLTVDDCEFLYATGAALSIAASDDVAITNSHFAYSDGDAIDVWDSPNVRITGNTIRASNDDAIGVHSNDVLNSPGQNPTPPVRAGIIITGNTIRDSQGPSILGAKMLIFANNTLQRIFGHGLEVTYSRFWHQGDTPIFAIRIADNIITDVFRRPWPHALNGEQIYLRIAGTPPARRLSATAPPTGAPDGIGALYANHVDAADTEAPAGHWIEVTGNLLLRTLPAVAQVRQWGFAPSLWVGQDNDGADYDGPIPEAALATTGLELRPAMRYARIAGNTIQTSAPRAITFCDAQGGESYSDLDWDQLTIERNRLIDCPAACLFYGGGHPTRQNILIRDNEIDVDPYRRAGDRIGLYLPDLAGAMILNNIFRNTTRPIATGRAPAPYAAGNLLIGGEAAVVPLALPK